MLAQSLFVIVSVAGCGGVAWFGIDYLFRWRKRKEQEERERAEEERLMKEGDKDGWPQI